MSSEDDDDNGVLRRTRSLSDSSSGHSVGSRQRKCHPEKLIEMSRRVREVGTAFVDDGAAISPTLAAIVSSKAFCLHISLKNRRTGEDSDTAVGQVGLIRGERLTQSPPQQKRAVAGEDDRPVSILRSSRFSVTPTTCLHNVASGPGESGDVIEYVNSKIVAPSGNSVRVNDFARAGYEVDEADAVVIRESDENDADRLFWKYGHDVTSAGQIENPHNHFTRKELSFEKMERQDYRFQVGQNIGIAVYRNFVVTAEDAGRPRNTLSNDYLRGIYGHENRVNIYTGQITHVSPDGKAFEHNINTFAGCSGALVFLLDQDENGVISADEGKAIAVHVGGKIIAPGRISNLAFKIL